MKKSQTKSSRLLCLAVSLSSIYDNLISSLNSQKIDELKWENIKALLIEEHLKRTEKDAKQPDSSSQNDAIFTTCLA